MQTCDDSACLPANASVGKKIGIRRQIILFLDEYTAGSKMIRASLQNLLTARCIGKFSLPPEVVIIGAANPGFEYGSPMLPSVQNRFCHIRWEQTPDDGIDFLSNKDKLFKGRKSFNVDAKKVEVIYRLLLEYAKKTESVLGQASGVDAFPTLRSLMMAARMIVAAGDDVVLQEAGARCCCGGFATEALAWIGTPVPSLEDLANGIDGDISRPDVVRLATVMALTRAKATKQFPMFWKAFNNIAKLNQEVAASMYKEAERESLNSGVKPPLEALSSIKGVISHVAI